MKFKFDKKELKLIIGNNDLMNVQTFLSLLVKSPSQRRKSFINKAFYKFEKEGFERISVQDIKEVYNADIHPLVQKGELTKENVVAEFLNNFSNWQESGYISKKEWDTYYAIVSLSIKEDDHFIQLMKTLWRLN